MAIRGHNRWLHMQWDWVAQTEYRIVRPRGVWQGMRTTPTDHRRHTTFKESRAGIGRSMARRFVLGAMVWACTVSLAHAQDMTLGEKLNRLKVPLTGLAIAGSLDVASTFTSTYGHGGREDNPAIAWLQPAGVSFQNTVIIGAIAESMAAVWICARLCEHHPRWAKTLTWTAAGIHGSMAAKNWANRGKHYRIYQGGK